MEKKLTELTKINSVSLENSNIGLVLSASNSDNTFALINFTQHILFQKKSVLYVAVNNSKRDIILKLSANVKTFRKSCLPKECAFKASVQITFDNIIAQINRTRANVAIIDGINYVNEIKNKSKLIEFIDQIKEIAIKLNVSIWLSSDILPDDLKLKFNKVVKLIQ